MYLHSRQGQLVFPKNTLEIAKIIGMERWKMNIKTRAKNPEAHNVGSEEENKIVDIRGVYAELIAQHFFSTNFIKYHSAPLLAEKAQTGADITLIGHHPDDEEDAVDRPICFIDVKSTKLKGTHFNVNQNSLYKDTSIDNYMFVQQASEYTEEQCVADYYVITAEDVRKWKVEKAGTARAYFSRKISDHILLCLMNAASI